MDVGGWLRSLGLGQYEALFRTNEIDADILPELTEVDFEKRALSCSMTFSSASLKGETDADSVWLSISRTMSRRILIARKSAEAERLTIG